MRSLCNAYRRRRIAVPWKQSCAMLKPCRPCRRMLIAAFMIWKHDMQTYYALCKQKRQDKIWHGCSELQRAVGEAPVTAVMAVTKMILPKFCGIAGRAVKRTIQRLGHKWPPSGCQCTSFARLHEVPFTVAAEAARSLRSGRRCRRCTRRRHAGRYLRACGAHEGLAAVSFFCHDAW